MMKRLPTTTALLFIILFWVSACKTHEPQASDIQGPPSYSSTVKEAPTIPFCQLIRDPSRYDKEVVRTEATFFRNMENAYLYDEACSGAKAGIWVRFDPAYVYTDDAVKRKLDQLLCPSQPCPTGRARVTVVGRFEGPSSGPYGHLDDYNFQLSLIRLEEAEAAEASDHHDSN